MWPSALSSSGHVKRSDTQDHSSPQSILIVDKHAHIVNILNWAFKLEGYETVAIDDQSLIGQTLAQERYFSAILLDLSRNLWLNRNAIIQFVEEQWHTFHYGDPPLIVLTTTPCTYKYVNGYPLFPKPFHIEDLLAMVRSVVS